MSEFEDFLIAQNDELEQTAYELLWRMTHPGADVSEMDDAREDFGIAQIGPLVEAAEDILQAGNTHCCHPYFDDSNTPCFLAGDCRFSPCPMKDNV